MLQVPLSGFITICCHKNINSDYNFLNLIWPFHPSFFTALYPVDDQALIWTLHSGFLNKVLDCPEFELGRDRSLQGTKTVAFAF